MRAARDAAEAHRRVMAPYEHMRASIGAMEQVVSSKTARFHETVAGPARSVVDSLGYASLKTPQFHAAVAGPAQAVVDSLGYASLKTPSFHAAVGGPAQVAVGMTAQVDHLRSPMLEPSRWYSEATRSSRDASEVLRQMTERHEAMMRPMREASRWHSEAVGPYRDATSRIGEMNSRLHAPSQSIGGAGRWQNEVAGNIVAGVNQVTPKTPAYTYTPPAVVFEPVAAEPALDESLVGQTIQATDESGEEYAVKVTAFSCYDHMGERKRYFELELPDGRKAVVSADDMSLRPDGR